MMDDDYGADESLLAAMAATDANQGSASRRVQQPTPRKIQQPTPQRMDKPPPSRSSDPSAKIVQPTPQSLPQKAQSGSTILVSPRQRGNPVLTCFKTMPWEYSDIPADYVLGVTTCAMFLSLKYHRLHPEYIYTRIRNLQGKYSLRVLLTLIDIPNHEDSLRELSKTSLVNNVTLLLCWSASEAAHYLELYKSYENASFASIKGQQASNYADKLVEFVTVPRSLNKSDAVALVANFGSLRNAVNADSEALSMIGGWGGVKVKRWMSAVEEPFRARKAAKRGLGRQRSTADNQDGPSGADRLEQAVPLSRVPLRDMPGTSRQGSSRGTPVAGSTSAQPQKQFQFMGDDDNSGDDDEEAMLAAAIEESKKTVPRTNNQGGQSTAGATIERGADSLGDGVAAALAKLREGG